MALCIRPLHYTSVSITHLSRFIVNRGLQRYNFADYFCYERRSQAKFQHFFDKLWVGKSEFKVSLKYSARPNYSSLVVDVVLMTYFVRVLGF